jgi:VWFA-related protein
MQPGDLVSIMTTSGGMGVMQQLTNDKRQLMALIDRIHYTLGRVGLTWYTPANIGDAARNTQAASSARLNGVRSSGQISGTLSAVAYAIQGLSEMPGRKAIAFFSDGFAIQSSRVIELANRASVTLYTFDSRGLAPFSLSAVDVCSSCAGHNGPAKITALEGGREAGFRASQAGLRLMALGTGGIFFHDDNGLDRGLGEALDDMSNYYLIGYQPRRDDFDLAGVRPKFHNIKVKVLRRGLQVRSRYGFMGTPDPAPPPPNRARLSEVGKAFWARAVP